MASTLGRADRKWACIVDANHLESLAWGDLNGWYRSNLLILWLRLNADAVDTFSVQRPEAWFHADDPVAANDVAQHQLRAAVKSRLMSVPDDQLRQVTVCR